MQTNRRQRTTTYEVTGSTTTVHMWRVWILPLLKQRASHAVSANGDRFPNINSWTRIWQQQSQAPPPLHCAFVLDCHAELRPRDDDCCTKRPYISGSSRFSSPNGAQRRCRNPLRSLPPAQNSFSEVLVDRPSYMHDCWYSAVVVHGRSV